VTSFADPYGACKNAHAIASADRMGWICTMYDIKIYDSMQSLFLLTEEIF
jgi:hypothetical protein